MQQTEQQKRNKLVFIIYLFQILSGVMLTITFKFQDKQKVDDAMFNHPYLQAIISFFGQTFNFLIYLGIKKFNPQDLEKIKTEAEQKGKKTDIPFKILIIPAVLHGLCSMTGIAAYFHIQASISMMLGGSLPAITAILSKIVFSIVILRHQKFGMAIIIIGSFVLGLTAVSNQETAEGASPTLGVILSFMSLFFFGCLMTAEEYLLKNYSVHSTIIAGTEGAFACIISLICIPIFNLASPGFVDIALFRQQVGKSFALQIGCIGIILFDMIYTLLCILSIKYSSGLLRSVIFQLRCIGIWIFALILPNPDYLGGGQWEQFHILQAIGYFILAIGVFFYNGNLRLKIFGLDKDLLKSEAPLPLQDKIDQNKKEFVEMSEQDQH